VGPVPNFPSAPALLLLFFTSRIFCRPATSAMSRLDDAPTGGFFFRPYSRDSSTVLYGVSFFYFCFPFEPVSSPFSFLFLSRFPLFSAHFLILNVFALLSPSCLPSPTRVFLSLFLSRDVGISLGLLPHLSLASLACDSFFTSFFSLGLLAPSILSLFHLLCCLAGE